MEGGIGIYNSPEHREKRDDQGCTFIPRIRGGLVPGPPLDTKIHGRSSPIDKMVQYFCITYTHSPVYFHSSLDYL